MSSIGKRKRNPDSKRYVSLKFEDITTPIYKGYSRVKEEITQYNLSFSTDSTDYRIELSPEDADKIKEFFSKN